MNQLFRKSVLSATKHLVSCGGYEDRATIEAKRFVDGCEEWHAIPCDCGDWRKVENMPCQIKHGDENKTASNGYTMRTVSAEIKFPFRLQHLTTSYRISVEGLYWNIDRWKPTAASTVVTVSRVYS